MRKKFAFCLILLLVAGILGLGCEDKTEVTEVEEQVVESEEPEPEPEPEPEVTEEESEPEEKGPLAENSRTNPAGLNKAFRVEKDDIFTGKVTYELELVEIISGEEAWAIIKDANIFNEEPENGKEYIMAKFRFQILETEEDEPYNVNHAQFEAVSGDGITYDDFISVSGVSPDLRKDLYEGAEHEGFTYFIVDKDDNPVAAYDRGRAGEVWFDLRAN